MNVPAYFVNICMTLSIIQSRITGHEFYPFQQGLQIFLSLINCRFFTKINTEKNKKLKIPAILIKAGVWPQRRF